MRISDWSSDVCSSDLTPLAQEERLHRYKVYAALAFARANKLDRMMLGDGERRFGIITAGKAYLDVRQALDDRSEERSVGKECVSTCRSRWSRTHYKKNTIMTHNYIISPSITNI